MSMLTIKELKNEQIEEIGANLWGCFLGVIDNIFTLKQLREWNNTDSKEAEKLLIDIIKKYTED